MLHFEQIEKHQISFFEVDVAATNVLAVNPTPLLKTLETLLFVKDKVVLKQSDDKVSIE